MSRIKPRIRKPYLPRGHFGGRKTSLPSGNPYRPTRVRFPCECPEIPVRGLDGHLRTASGYCSTCRGWRPPPGRLLPEPDEPQCANTEQPD